MGKSKLEPVKQIKSLKFSNPGRFMEDFDPEYSKREMRKVQRRCYKDTRRGNKSRFYDEHGLRLSDGHDVCDCLNNECPGCHMPCPRCSSNKCGAECRVNRPWFYSEIKTEGAPRLRTLPDQEFVEMARLAKRVKKCRL